MNKMVSSHEEFAITWQRRYAHIMKINTGMQFITLDNNITIHSFYKGRTLSIHTHIHARTHTYKLV